MKFGKDRRKLIKSPTRMKLKSLSLSVPSNRPRKKNIIEQTSPLDLLIKMNGEVELKINSDTRQLDKRRHMRIDLDATVKQRERRGAGGRPPHVADPRTSNPRPHAG